jgi:sporadic carbohydrate cluster protein (TIGR04323 family)
MNKAKKGYRGYIGSRPYAGIDFPQNLQNFLIRSYCQKHQLHYLLSATEYKMPACYMILEEVLSHMPTLEGIVLCSIFMLPESITKRQRIYDIILNNGCSLHAALEDLMIRNKNDVSRIENILRLNKIVSTNQAISELWDFSQKKTSIITYYQAV